MIHDLKPILLTAVITTSTVFFFMNSVLGLIILILTAIFWLKKNQIKNVEKEIKQLELKKLKKDLGELGDS